MRSVLFALALATVLLLASLPAASAAVGTVPPGTIPTYPPRQWLPYVALSSSAHPDRLWLPYHSTQFIWMP